MIHFDHYLNAHISFENVNNIKTNWVWRTSPRKGWCNLIPKLWMLWLKISAKCSHFWYSWPSLQRPLPWAIDAAAPHMELVLFQKKQQTKGCFLTFCQCCESNSQWAAPHFTESQMKSWVFFRHKVYGKDYCSKKWQHTPLRVLRPPRCAPHSAVLLSSAGQSPGQLKLSSHSSNKTHAPKQARHPHTLSPNWPGDEADGGAKRLRQRRQRSRIMGLDYILALITAGGSGRRLFPKKVLLKNF